MATPAETEALATRLRATSLRMVARANASHIGSCLSMADVLAVLYGHVLRVRPDEPVWEDRDRVIVSKGHAAAIVYAVLAERGFFPPELLETYGDDGCPFPGHVTHTKVPGVEVSTGSLGHGLPIAAGMAIAGKRDRATHRIVTVLSDGELDEGSVWEATLFAGHHGLDNLVAIVDYNKIQSFGTVEEVLDLHPLADKFRAFGWSVREVDGHDHGALHEALGTLPFESGRPSCLVAHTIKGKGVSFMENDNAWHYRAPKGGQLDQALAELGVAP